MASMRHAIRTEIRLVVSELATDLVRFPQTKHWSAEDLQVMAGLIVNAMVSTVEEIFDAPANDPTAELEIQRLAEKQLPMIVVAAPAWRSTP